MNYITNEGGLSLPSAFYHDASINMLRFEKLGTTLVISRARLKEDETLESNFDAQVKKLEGQTKDLRFQQKNLIMVGVRNDIPAIEVKNQYRSGENHVYQMQAVCELSEKKVMALSYIKPSPLGDEEMKHWKLILEGLEFK